MYEDSRPPQTATRTTSSHDCHDDDRIAHTTATSSSAMPQAVSTTETRPACQATYAVAVITTTATASVRPVTRRRSRTRPPEVEQRDRLRRRRARPTLGLDRDPGGGRGRGVAGEQHGLVGLDRHDTGGDHALAGLVEPELVDLALRRRR